MIPTFEEFLYPFLLMLKDGELSNKDMKKKLVAYFNLTEEDLSQTTQGGNTTQVADRIGWCRQYFRRALFIDIPQKGIWKLTDRGKGYLANHKSLTISDLMEYKEFAEYAGGKKTKKEVVPSKPSIASLGITPTDALEEAHKSINESLSDELLSMIMNLSPKFFEKLVVDLLVSMGYGGDYKDAAEVTQANKDGGVDGIIKEDKLGLDKIYIQAKRWAGVVGKPIVQQFAGALDEVKASKGVFITTSAYSKDAKKYVENLSKKIVLIDGKQLTAFMIEYNLGVSVKKAYVVKRIDTDYFEEAE